MNAFFVAATPLLPGVRKLPTAVCFDGEGKELPSQCVVTQVTVVPFVVCFDDMNEGFVDEYLRMVVMSVGSGLIVLALQFYISTITNTQTQPTPFTIIPNKHQNNQNE